MFKRAISLAVLVGITNFGAAQACKECVDFLQVNYETTIEQTSQGQRDEAHNSVVNKTLNELRAMRKESANSYEAGTDGSYLWGFIDAGIDYLQKNHSAEASTYKLSKTDIQKISSSLKTSSNTTLKQRFVPPWVARGYLECLKIGCEPVQLKLNGDPAKEFVVSIEYYPKKGMTGVTVSAINAPGAKYVGTKWPVPFTLTATRPSKSFTFKRTNPSANSVVVDTSAGAYILALPDELRYVAVDAHDADWKSTGLMLRKGESFFVRSNGGKWYMGGGLPKVSADGFSPYCWPFTKEAATHPTTGNKVGSAKFGALIGKIGDQEFELGADVKSRTAPADGELMLMSNDGKVDGAHADNHDVITFTCGKVSEIPESVTSGITSALRTTSTSIVNARPGSRGSNIRTTAKPKRVDWRLD